MANYNLPENWDSFPVREAVSGGVKKKIKVDEANDIIYLLDENGDWTGEKSQKPGIGAALSKKEKAAAPAESETPENSTPDEAEDPDDDEKEEQAPVKKKRRPRKSSLTPVLLVIIAILAGLLLLQNSGGIASPNQYSVIIAMENIQPGDTVAGKLSSATISAEEYYRYANEGGLYSPDEYQDIKEYVATEFIPANGCITYANVGESFQMTNPWMMDVGYTITLPVDVSGATLEDFIWGTNVYLEIRVEYTIGEEHYPDADRPTSPEVKGESILRYVQVDDYILENFTIVDVLDNRQQSLYSSYAAMTAIPELYQQECLLARYLSEDEIEADIPAYIKIEVSEATAKWWATAAYKSKITVRAYAVGISCENELQNDTYTKIKSIVPKVVYAWENAEIE